jgi:hypothetical protein
MQATSAARRFACGIALAALAYGAGCTWRPLNRHRAGADPRGGARSSAEFISESPRAAHTHRQPPSKQIAAEPELETMVAQKLEDPPDPPPLEAGPSFQTDAHLLDDDEALDQAPAAPSETPDAEPAPVEPSPSEPATIESAQPAVAPNQAPESEPAPSTPPPADAVSQHHEPESTEAPARQDVGVALAAAPNLDINQLPPQPSQPPNSEETWKSALDDLLALTKRQAAEEKTSGAPGIWLARVRDLERLASLDTSVPAELESAEPGPSNASASQTSPPGEHEPARSASAVDPEPNPVEVPPVHDVAVEPGPQESNPAPALEITELAFCRRIDGFGSYEPVAADGIRAGRPVGLYWEVAGLKHEENGGWFRTRVGCIIEILPEAGGEAVWRDELDEAEDRCRRVRRDYFINTRLTLPEKLAPAKYLLRLTLHDLQAGSSTTRSIPFEISG